jgi:Uma2 family endonuclease
VAATRIPEFEVLEGDTPFILRWKNPPDFSDDELLEFFTLNDDLQFEFDCDGSLLIMSPEAFDTGARSASLTGQLHLWAKTDRTGIALGASAGYYLPNRAMRGPDASWTRRDRVDALPQREIEHIPHLVPDFVVELRSRSNSLRRRQEKMDEYLANGVRLGWLLDPTTKTAYVYRAGGGVQVIEGATTLDAAPELPGFVLDLAPIWNE